MTNEQNTQIVQMRDDGKSYAVIARELGLPRSTVSNFCLRNDGKDLIRTQGRGNTVNAGSFENKRIPACKVYVEFAEKPNEDALAAALQILMNVR